MVKIGILLSRVSHDFLINFRNVLFVLQLICRHPWQVSTFVYFPFLLTFRLNFISAKHCEKLTTKVKGQTISVPCFSSFGSTCYFGCRPGFFLQGDGRANCSLNSKGDGVSWEIGSFTCEGKLFILCLWCRGRGGREERGERGTGEKRPAFYN